MTLFFSFSYCIFSCLFQNSNFKDFFLFTKCVFNEWQSMQFWNSGNFARHEGWLILFILFLKNRTDRIFISAKYVNILFEVINRWPTLIRNHTHTIKALKLNEIEYFWQLSLDTEKYAFHLNDLWERWCQFQQIH